MENILPFLRNKIEVSFIKRTRGFWDKTVGIAWKILRAEGDLIHVNYGLQDAFFARKLKRLDVLYLHGSDIREALFSKLYAALVRGNLKGAKVVLCSTEDLLPIVRKYRDDTTLLPRPVRTDLFIPKIAYHNPPRAIYFPKRYDHLPSQLLKLLHEKNISLTFQRQPIPYKQMPQFLSQFEIFVDQLTIPSVSKTCLEAESCGLATIDFSHKNRLRSYVAELGDIENIKKIGNANREFVVKNHNAELVAERLLCLWKATVNHE
jgi:hypothetical protein